MHGASTLHYELGELVVQGLRMPDPVHERHGLESFPELLRRFDDDEIARIHGAVAALLADLARNDDVDWAAVGVTLQGATAHYWLLRDLFGEHPTDVDEERLVQAVTALAAALISTA